MTPELTRREKKNEEMVSYLRNDVDSRTNTHEDTTSSVLRLAFVSSKAFLQAPQPRSCP